MFDQWVTVNVDGLLNENCLCGEPILGCLEPLACNFSPTANSDDGSCDYSCVI